MPPKANSSSSNKGAAARGKQADDVLHVSVQELNSVDTFNWIHHEVDALRNFEQSWRLTGAQLIGFSPVGFIPNLQAELPMLPRSTCIEVFIALQNKIKEEIAAASKDGTPSEPSAAFKSWIEATIPTMLVSTPIPIHNQVLPVNLANMFSPSMQAHGGSANSFLSKPKFVFGSPAIHLTRFKEQTPSLLSQYPALSLNLNRQTYGQLPPMPPLPGSAGPAMLKSAAGVDPSSGSAGFARFNSAPGFDQNSSAARAAMLHSAPGTATVQSVLRQAMNHSAAGVTMNSPLSPEDAGQLQLILNNPQLAPLFLKFAGPALNSPTKPVMPWVTAAQERGPMVQDENMPLGYKRINLHEIIKAAVEERKRNPALIDTGKAIKWPIGRLADPGSSLIL
jgi:hypothetical protein